MTARCPHCRCFIPRIGRNDQVYQCVSRRCAPNQIREESERLVANLPTALRKVSPRDDKADGVRGSTMIEDPFSRDFGWWLRGLCRLMNVARYIKRIRAEMLCQAAAEEEIRVARRAQ